MVNVVSITTIVLGGGHAVTMPGCCYCMVGSDWRGGGWTGADVPDVLGVEMALNEGGQGCQQDAP